MERAPERDAVSGERIPTPGLVRRSRRRLRALRTGIVFTRVFEDGDVDREALAIEPGDEVLVIASAGDKALDAIAWGAGRVDAVDTNVAQLHLVALKLAAVRALDPGELIDLFSRGRSATALLVYERRLRPALDEPARRYWDRWIEIFEIGLHQHNPLGLAIAAVCLGLRLLGGRRLVPVIMRAPDAPAQARVYERSIRRRYWNPWTRWLLGRAVLLRALVLDPAERAAMTGDGLAGWLEKRISRVVATSLIRENPYWMPLLTGRLVAPEHEVPWLRPDNLERLAAGAQRVRLVCGSIVDALAGCPAGTYAAVDLSNVPDWLTPSERVHLWAGLSRALRPGGRVVLRSVFVAPPLPTGATASSFVRDEALSASLTDVERTGIYRSVVILRRTATEDRRARHSGDDEPDR